MGRIVDTDLVRKLWRNISDGIGKPDGELAVFWKWIWNTDRKYGNRVGIREISGGYAAGILSGRRTCTGKRTEGSDCVGGTDDGWKRNGQSAGADCDRTGSPGGSHSCRHVRQIWIYAGETDGLWLYEIKFLCYRQYNKCIQRRIKWTGSCFHGSDDRYRRKEL